MKTRDKHIQQLEKLWDSNELGFDSGSLRCWFLTPHYFKNTVQVAECFDRDGNETPVHRHAHKGCYEIFVQLEGETYFPDDGTTLREHETKVLPPGVEHVVVPRKGSKFIVVIHPPDELFAAKLRG